MNDIVRLEDLDAGKEAVREIIFYPEIILAETVPKVGDDWGDGACEVVDVESIDMEDMEDHDAYIVRYIDRGADKEREDPFEDYIAIARE